MYVRSVGRNCMQALLIVALLDDVVQAQGHNGEAIPETGEAGVTHTEAAAPSNTNQALWSSPKSSSRMCTNVRTWTRNE